MTIGIDTWQSLLIEHLQKSIKPLIVILGPTASGKTRFSIDLALRLRSHSASSEPSAGRSAWPIEIINADSRQFYKYMDIGTAKITEEEKEGIPHHLFSVLDPKEKVTVGWYKKAAEKVIDDILARGSVPILVGGSMLYISAVTDGYVFTGKGGKRRAPIPYDLLIFGIWRPREELVKRIEERTEDSLSPPLGPELEAEGRERVRVRGNWLSEVAWLLAHGYKTSDPGMESHGYREIAEWILNGRTEEDLSPLINRINAATRQYAKRQMTWWKGDERIQWIPCN